MNSYIKGIAVFKDKTDNGKRILKLDRGLNIISGNSKTGKSAILDIIDWCLGAELCTIPKGKITAFTAVYSLIIEFNGKSLLLAREDEIKGRNFMFIKEIESNIDINDISLDDFNRQSFFRRNEVLEKINEIIDLTINKEAQLFGYETKMPKTNIRDSLCYVFQHQDIIKSNSRLFYFDPKPNHFPVLAGWYGHEYYITLKQIDALKTQIKSLNKKRDDAIKANQIFENNFKNSIRIYYNLIGIEFNEEWSINELISRYKNLENFKKEEYNDSLLKRQEQIEKQLEELYAEQTLLNRNLQKIKSKIAHGDHYKLFLEKYNERVKHFEPHNEYDCPVCGKLNNDLTIEALNIIEAGEKLKKELITVPTQIFNYHSESVEINEKLPIVKDKIKLLKDEYQSNSKILSKIINEKNLNELKQKAQWKVQSDFEILESRGIKFDDHYLESQRAELLKQEIRKRSFNISEKYESEKIIIEDQMSLIVEKLDFEHRPPELYFELNPEKEDCFKLYHNAYGQERIFLRQIGSASNALACHLGLFLSFQKYFCSQRNSKVPSILFLDQPSQVYFPSGADTTDIEKVGQIYETLLDEITNIENESGIIPQIIVADHVRDLGEATVKLYQHYFKADWRNGNAFI